MSGRKMNRRIVFVRVERDHWVIGCRLILDGIRRLPTQSFRVQAGRLEDSVIGWTKLGKYPDRHNLWVKQVKQYKQKRKVKS